MRTGDLSLAFVLAVLRDIAVIVFVIVYTIEVV